jgi:hypothetical protein
MISSGNSLLIAKLKLSSYKFETTTDFTKSLGTPIRDSSMTAAQREKQSTPNKRIHFLKEKLKQVAEKKTQLEVEKEEFKEYKKQVSFLNKINQIVEIRWKVENKAALLIQSIFRGYIQRKRLLQVIFK